MAITSSLISITAGTAAIAENIFKGFANISTGCFIKKMSVPTGFKQLSLGLGINIIRLVLRVIYAAFDVFRAIFGLCKNPNHFADDRYIFNEMEKSRLKRNKPLKIRFQLGHILQGLV